MTDPALTQAIRALYAGDPDREWARLARHRTEFAVSLRALDAHLPPAPARVLDCGGGPGRYAIELARRGYQVTLFDLSPDLLAMAREMSAQAGVTLAGFEQGTATDLARFPEASFDAVLLMGPLYHLLDVEDRRKALAEAYRVVRPGGPIFAAFITRYAGQRYAAAHDPELATQDPALYRTLLETGHLPPRASGGFVAYMAHPTEVAPLCRSAGFDVETVLGVEGLVSMIEDGVNALDGPAWDYWVDVNYGVADDPTIHGAVEHLLAVCRRPRWKAVLRRIAAHLNAQGIPYAVVGGAALALRGLPVPVHDIDLEMPLAGARRFAAGARRFAAGARRFAAGARRFAAEARRFADHVDVVAPLAWREGEDVRSHLARLEVDGVPVEVMAELVWRVAGRWEPSFYALQEVEDVLLEGVPVRVLSLEAETLAYIRRGRLDRAAVALPHCDSARFQALLLAWRAGEAP